MKYLLALAALVFIVAFSSSPRKESTPVPTSTPSSNTGDGMVADWDHLPVGSTWSAITLKAIDELGPNLMTATVLDAVSYCPHLNSLMLNQKRGFYLMLISAMTRYESGFDPSVKYEEDFYDVDGDHVFSRGLLQLSKESANGYGCGIRNSQELHDPEVNIRCAVRIINRWVSNDRYIGSYVHRYLGAARYWGVLRNSRKAMIQEKTKALPYCGA